LWAVYGVLEDDVFIIGTNVAAIVLVCIVLVMKHSYAKRGLDHTDNV